MEIRQKQLKEEQLNPPFPNGLSGDANIESPTYGGKRISDETICFLACERTMESETYDARNVDPFLDTFLSERLP
jgi:hypothetical protein